MNTQLLLYIAAFLGAITFGLTCLMLRFRGRDCLFFAAVLLPNIWLSRFDVNEFNPYRLDFPTFWLVLLAIIALSILALRTKTVRLLWGPGKGIWGSMALLLFAIALSTVVHSRELGDFVRGFHASCFVALPFMGAWCILQCCHVDERAIARAVTAILIAGTVAALASVLSATWPSFFRSILATYRRASEAERAFSPLGGPSAVAMCLLMVYCLAVGQLMGKRHRLLSLVVLGLCFLGLLTTLARAALIAFLAANIYLYGRHLRGFGGRLVIFVVTGAVVLLPAVYGLSRVYSLERFGDDWSGARAGSVRLRLESMQTAISYGAHHLPFGGGWGLVYYPAREIGSKQARERLLTFEEGRTASKPHSLFALVFAEAGILGFVFLLLLFWQIWRHMRPPDVRFQPYGHCIVHGFRTGFLSFLVFSVAQDHLFFASKISLFFYLFVFMGVAASTYYRVADAVRQDTATDSQAEPSQPITPLSRPGGRWRDPLPEI